MKKCLSKSLEDTEKFAREWVGHIPVSLTGKATIIGLSGDLGSGKTALVKAVAKELGIKEEITSPTFVIEKIYQLSSNSNPTGFTHLIHIDAYRIENGSELITLGWDKIKSDPNNLILVEWPENIKDILPANTKTIKCEFVDDKTHIYTIE